MLPAGITQTNPGYLGGDQRLFSKEKGEGSARDRAKSNIAHGISAWGLSQGLHPCWDPAHHAVVLNLSQNL